MNESLGGGVIQGGWEYVIAAYAATALVLIAYVLSVLRRDRTPPAPPLRFWS